MISFQQLLGTLFLCAWWLPSTIYSCTVFANKCVLHPSCGVCNERRLPICKYWAIAWRCSDAGEQVVFFGRVGNISKRGKEHEQAKVSECAIHSSHKRSIWQLQDMGTYNLYEFHIISSNVINVNLKWYNIITPHHAPCWDQEMMEKSIRMSEAAGPMSAEASGKDHGCCRWPHSSREAHSGPRAPPLQQQNLTTNFAIHKPNKD